MPYKTTPPVILFIILFLFPPAGELHGTPGATFALWHGSPASRRDLCFCSIDALITRASCELGQHHPRGTTGHPGRGRGGGPSRIKRPSFCAYFHCTDQSADIHYFKLKCRLTDVALQLAYCSPPHSLPLFPATSHWCSFAWCKQRRPSQTNEGANGVWQSSWRMITFSSSPSGRGQPVHAPPLFLPPPLSQHTQCTFHYCTETTTNTLVEKEERVFYQCVKYSLHCDAKWKMNPGTVQ